MAAMAAGWVGSVSRATVAALWRNRWVPNAVPNRALLARRTTPSMPPWRFAFDDSRPLACFAGIWTRWSAVRKVKEGEVSADIFGFLTINPNGEVGAIHPKAMPVILRTPEEADIWMTAPAAEALTLQRSLPDGALQIVAQGAKEDAGASAAASADRLL